MINYKIGDALASTDEVLVHCANCFCTFGAGIAAQIKRKIPAAFTADCKTKSGDKSKLGTFTKSVGQKTVYNLYGQYGFANAKNKKPLDYAALNSALFLMAEDLRLNDFKGKISMPRIGAGLAGGDWNKIVQMIEHHLYDYDVTVWSFA